MMKRFLIFYLRLNQTILQYLKLFDTVLITLYIRSPRGRIYRENAWQAGGLTLAFVPLDRFFLVFVPGIPRSSAKRRSKGFLRRLASLT
jgi:hypothetical protein